MVLRIGGCFWGPKFPSTFRRDFGRRSFVGRIFLVRICKLNESPTFKASNQLDKKTFLDVGKPKFGCAEALWTRPLGRMLRAPLAQPAASEPCGQDPERDVLLNGNLEGPGLKPSKVSMAVPWWVSVAAACLLTNVAEAGEGTSSKDPDKSHALAQSMLSPVDPFTWFCRNPSEPPDSEHQ